jgi:acyl transferase domain-containing protein
VLALQNETIPPQLHYQSLNPHINLTDTPFAISATSVTWPRSEKSRLAGVSSFGFGGTNAHVILEEAPRLPQKPITATPPYLIPLSAHSPQALQALASQTQDYLADLPDEALLDFAVTWAKRRNHYVYRWGLVGARREELQQRLQDFVDQPSATTNQNRGKRLFVFSGQGPQWWAMGRELLATEPVFRQTIEQVDQLLRQYTSDWFLLDELQADEADSRLDQTEIAQPAIFALQIGLSVLWQSWGIQPQGVVGHSVGEIAAAYTAGVLTLEDAVRVVYHRGRLMQQATGLGKMGAVSLSFAEAEQLVKPYGDRLTIGAINSSTSTVLSGEAEALAEALATVQERGLFNRMLQVDYAFHSAQMAPFQGCGRQRGGDGWPGLPAAGAADYPL